MKKVCLIVLATLCAVACVKKEDADYGKLLGLEYFPAVNGSFIVYDADSVVYQELPRDTLIYRYRIKEKFAGVFTDNEDKPAFRLERYIKWYDPLLSYDSIPWKIKEVWTVRSDYQSVQVTESNVRYTKLIFPVQEKANWKGNAGNTKADWTYSYDYVDKTETIGGKLFEKVLLVKQRDYRTAISYELYEEKYAKNIGLVERTIKDLYSNSVVANVPVEDRIERGFTYKLTYVTHGTE